MGATPTVISDTPALTRALAPLKTYIDTLLADVFNRGQTIANIAVIAGTPFTVPHGLGRTFTGYAITRAVPTGTAALVVRDYAMTPAVDPARAIGLICSGTGTISLRVF